MKKFYWSMVFVIIFLLSVNVSAETTFDLKVDMKKKQVTILGNTDSDKYVNLTCITNADDLIITQDNVMESVFFAKEIPVDSDGGFSQTFIIPEKKSNNFYRVVVNAGGEKQKKDFFCPDVNTITQMLLDFNNVTADTLETNIIKYSNEYPILIFNIEDYNKWKNEINSEFISIKNALPNKKFINEVEINDTLGKSIAYATIINATKDELCSYLKCYANYIGLTITNDYSKYEVDFCELIYNKRNQATDIKQLTSIVRECFALASLNNSQREDITKVLNDYNDIFYLDLTGDYLKYDKIEVNKALYKKAYTDVISVRNDFENRISELKSENSLPQSSSGGGSSVGGGISGKIPVESKPDTDVPVAEKMKVVFNDISQVPWAQAAILSLAEKNIIKGVCENEFMPNDYLTRAQVCQIICNAFEMEKKVAVGNFNDVDVNAWYAEAVNKVSNAGIVLGYNNSFSPDKYITRQDMAVIIYRLIGELKIKTTKEKFKDFDKISSYAQVAVATLYELEILNGTHDNSFEPQVNITRAQAAVMIHNVIKSVGGVYINEKN